MGEVPPAGLPSLEEDFWVVRPLETSQHMNTMILVRKQLFCEPSRQDFKDEKNEFSSRVIGCTFFKRDASQQIHVIGVHLAGKGVDVAHWTQQLDAVLRP